MSEGDDLEEEVMARSGCWHRGLDVGHDGDRGTGLAVRPVGLAGAETFCCCEELQNTDVSINLELVAYALVVGAPGVGAVVGGRRLLLGDAVRGGLDEGHR